MTDELALPADTDVNLSEIVTRETVHIGVSKALDHLYKTGDIQFAVRTLNAFAKFEDVTGFGRAEFLWGCQQWFITTQQDGDFYEKFGVTEKNNKVYVDRLIHLWQQLQSGAVPARIAKRNIRELTPITEALSQGYDFTEEDWNHLEQAVDSDEIWAYIQKDVKKKETRSHAIKLVVDGHGSIYAWHQNKRHFVGSLNFQERDDDPIIAKAILRIIAAAKLKEK